MSISEKDKVGLSLIKWAIIMVAGAALFYAVYPKYYFHVKPDQIRCNKITGKVEYFEGPPGNYRWMTIEEVNNQ